MEVPRAPGLLQIKVPEVNLGKSYSTVEWSHVGQYLGHGSMKVESRGFNTADKATVDRQPRHEDDSAGEGNQFQHGMPPDNRSCAQSLLFDCWYSILQRFHGVTSSSPY